MGKSACRWQRSESRKLHSWFDSPTPWISLDHSNFTVTYRDIPGQSLGTTTETGTGAEITLDADAAGYGWYIDPALITTPDAGRDQLIALDMDNWLPTSNPGEWQAKAGSAAEGKMDMLTALFHELGHALGLEHSQAAHDVMTATLSPGMRRLPVGDEWPVFAQLIEGTSLAQNLEQTLRAATAAGQSNGDLPNPLPDPSAPMAMASLVAAAIERGRV